MFELIIEYSLVMPSISFQTFFVQVFKSIVDT